MKLEDFAAYNRPQSKVSDERKFLDYIHSRNRWVEFIKSIDNAKPVSIAMKIHSIVNGLSLGPLYVKRSTTTQFSSNY